MEKSKTLFWGLIVLVVLVLVILFAGRDRSVVQTNENGEVVEEIAPGQEKAVANEGSVVAGFPLSLVLFDDIRVLESYSIAYDNLGASQPVLEYAVMAGSDEVAEAYRAYFAENEWSITSDINSPDEEASFLYATKDNMDASVNVVAVNGESKVVVAYVKRQE